MAADGVEHFAPTAGRITGVLGLILAAGILVLGVIRPDDVIAPVAAGAAVCGVLAWTSLLRPRVSASPETLVLRNMLETVHIPLAAIDELAVRQVLAVRVGGKRFVCAGIGRKLRKIVRGPRPNQLLGPNLPEGLMEGSAAQGGERTPTTVDYADHVEERLRQLVADARDRHGVRAYSDEAEALAAGVRREPSWPEIAALSLALLAFVLTLLVG